MNKYELQARLDELTSERMDVEGQIAILEDEIEELQYQRDRIDTEIDEVEHELMLCQDEDEDDAEDVFEDETQLWMF